LSLEYERRRLAAIGLGDREPILVSIDDNTVGYDLISFDFDANRYVQEIRIEVKVSSNLPIRFIITANEWDVCLENPAIYRIHIWELQTRNLKILLPDDVRSHLPINIGLGRWTQAELSIKDTV
jgi:hypothetical protein